MLNINLKFLFTATLYLSLFYQYCSSWSYGTESENIKNSNKDENVIHKEDMKSTNSQNNGEEISQNNQGYKYFSQIKGLRNYSQVYPRNYGDKKYYKQGNSAHLFYRQPDRSQKDRLEQDEYKTTKIKEAESAERNLKKLLKILNESMFFQSGGLPQQRNKETNRRKMPDPLDNDEYETQQDFQVSNPKGFSKDNDMLLIQPTDLVKEILKKEFKTIFKSKPGKTQMIE